MCVRVCACMPVSVRACCGAHLGGVLTEIGVCKKGDDFNLVAGPKAADIA